MEAKALRPQAPKEAKDFRLAALRLLRTGAGLLPLATLGPQSARAQVPGCLVLLDSQGGCG